MKLKSCAHTYIIWNNIVFIVSSLHSPPFSKDIKVEALHIKRKQSTVWHTLVITYFERMFEPQKKDENTFESTVRHKALLIWKHTRLHNYSLRTSLRRDWIGQMLCWGGINPSCGLSRRVFNCGRLFPTSNRFCYGDVSNKNVNSSECRHDTLIIMAEDGYTHTQRLLKLLWTTHYFRFKEDKICESCGLRTNHFKWSEGHVGFSVVMSMISKE